MQFGYIPGRFDQGVSGLISYRPQIDLLPSLKSLVPGNLFLLETPVIML
jgi:hypothetical protein